MASTVSEGDKTTYTKKVVVYNGTCEPLYLWGVGFKKGGCRVYIYIYILYGASFSFSFFDCFKKFLSYFPPTKKIPLIFHYEKNSLHCILRHNLL